EELGRVEVLQRLVERLGRIGLARSKVRVGANRFSLEALVSANGDRANRVSDWSRHGRRWRSGLARGGLRRRRLALLGRRCRLGEQRRGRASKDGSGQQKRARAPTNILRS